METAWSIEGRVTAESDMQPGVTQVSIRLEEDGIFVAGHAPQMDLRLRSENGDRFRRGRKYRITFTEVEG
jgi:hypothetical protein